MTAIGPGTRVRCIKRGAWWSGAPGPTFGSLWTVVEVWPGQEDPTKQFLQLGEWPKWRVFWIENFVPLSGDSELERLREIARNPSKLDQPMEIAR